MDQVMEGAWALPAAPVSAMDLVQALALVKAATPAAVPKDFRAELGQVGAMETIPTNLIEFIHRRK
jgi:hypothetical protein